MVQGGDPTNSGTGGDSGFPDGKPFRDELDSRLTFQGGGLLGMANPGIKNSNRSQFFITYKSAEHLTNRHTLFGRCVGGLDVLKAMERIDTDAGDRPKQTVKILKTVVFKNPIKSVTADEAKEQEELEKGKPPPVSFSEVGFAGDREVHWHVPDPLKDHAKRESSEVGKYLSAGKAAPRATPADLEYGVLTAAKPKRTGFGGANFAQW